MTTTTPPCVEQQGQQQQQPNGVWVYIPLPQPFAAPVPNCQENAIPAMPIPPFLPPIAPTCLPSLYPSSSIAPLTEEERRRHLAAMQKHEQKMKYHAQKQLMHAEKLKLHAEKLQIKVDLATTNSIDDHERKRMHAEKIRRQNEQRMSQLFVAPNGFLDYGRIPIVPE